MMRYADLEIGLQSGENHDCLVQFRYRPPDSAAESRPEGGPIRIDLDALAQLTLDPRQYGQALADSFFANPNVLKSFSEARASAEALEVPLRARLLIDPDTPELHAIRWETMRDPRDGTFLFSEKNLYWSRYSLTTDYRPVRLRLKSQLQALVMVANPTNLAEYQLEPIDVQGEIDIARRGLGEIPATVLPEPERDQRASIDNLIDQLRDHQYDIIYLICHGSFVKEQSWLWLEGEDGKAARISGDDFIQRMQNLADGRPSLIVLASCQSAGDGSAVALSALGPRLAVAGVPAVIAMQGKISMDTVGEFMPLFFEELREHGVIDRAVAVAREKVQDRPDFWMPVLSMRLEKGSLWSGFIESEAFNKWPALVSLLKRKQVTPILGSGLVEPILGSMREIAGDWAEKHHYPLYDYEHNSLPRIAQYLSVQYYESFPGDELEEDLRTAIQRKHRTELPEALLKSGTSLDELINKIGANRRQRVAWDAYKILADMDLPVYITANYNKLLESALEEAGKSPRTLISPWNDYVVETEPLYGLAATGEDPPTPDNPLVYHLFGRLNEPDSVVLNEDDYFKYLIGVTENRDLVPTSIQEALTNRALLFLGFHLEDWDFRVLFQSLLSFEGGALRKSGKKNFVSIAVQLEPEGLANPDSARTYLESYFGKEDIYLYWGSSEDFIKELMYYLPEMDEEGRP